MVSSTCRDRGKEHAPCGLCMKSIVLRCRAALSTHYYNKANTQERPRTTAHNACSAWAIPEYEYGQRVQANSLQTLPGPVQMARTNASDVVVLRPLWTLDDADSGIDLPASSNHVRASSALHGDDPTTLYEVHELHIVRGVEDAERILDPTAALDAQPNLALMQLLQVSQKSSSVVLTYRRPIAAYRANVQPRRTLRPQPARSRSSDAFFAVLAYDFCSASDCDSFSHQVQSVAGRDYDPRRVMSALRDPYRYRGVLQNAFLVEAEAEVRITDLRVASHHFDTRDVLVGIFNAAEHFAARTVLPDENFSPDMLLRRQALLDDHTPPPLPPEYVGELRDALVRTRLLLNSLPCRPTIRMGNMFRRWENYAFQARTAVRLESLPHYRESLARFEDELGYMDEAYTLWIEHQLSLDAPNARHDRDARSWSFGINTVISGRRLRVSAGKTVTVAVLPRLVTGTRTKTVRLSPALSAVGWRLRSLNGRGTWGYTDDSILLDRDSTRICRWELTTFHVQNNPDFLWYSFIGRYGRTPNENNVQQ